MKRNATVVALTAVTVLGGGGDALAADKVLSNERTLTRWAHPWTPSPVRAAPSGSSRMVGRLHFKTEDGVPEVYMALRSSTVDGREWIQIRMLGRPNGRKGWVPRDALGGFNTVRTQLVINIGALRATLFKRGRRIWSSSVGVGKAATPTPKGRYYIRERLRSLGGAYGPWAFGTSAYSRLSDWPGGGVVGIHGTNQPQLIPGRPSHGCVRVPNFKIRQLARKMPIGTPIHIK